MVGRGYTIMEIVFAMAVFGVIAAVALLGPRGHLAHVGRTFDEVTALRAAATRLEELGAGSEPLAPGEERFGAGRQVVRELEPGLYEVTVRVGSASLTTLFARRSEP